jgi:oxaloacetate decarboxylase alpha subunit
MTTEEMLPVLEKMDQAGFYSMEVWGGATFDACLRFLREDPWERLRVIRKRVKNTKLQMLFRGQNMVGYRVYPDDVVEEFIKHAIGNGIDIVRIFDALNDARNLESSVKAVKKYGGSAQLAIAYTLSEVHTLDYYVRLAREYESLGADSICVKDMSGLLLPYAAYELVAALKRAVKLPLQVHSHFTSGLASMSYLKAVEAGADIIDTAMSPFALGTSQPATEVMAEVLSGTPYDPGLDREALRAVGAALRPLREAAMASGLMSIKVLGVDIDTLTYQVPGGMLSNLVSQLKTQGAEAKFEQVLREIPAVRADFGYPPLVTPSSQIVGTQAVLNVVMGERYKMVPKESRDFVKGMYGKTPVPISEDVRKKIIGDEKQVTARPADLLPPALPEAAAKTAEYWEQPEDVVTYALFPNVAPEFFKYRQAQKYKADPARYDKANKVYPV